MADVYRLSDGITTIALSSGNYRVLDYQMGALDDKSPDEITETLELLISGASHDSVRDDMRAVEKLLEAAKRRKQWQSGPRVYLQIQWDGDAANWQSEIVDGRLETDRLPGQLWRRKVQCALIVTRKFFETVDWTQLTLTNTNGTDNTAGLNVYAVNDGVGSSPNDRVNYLAIDAAEVTGVLPAPVKVELANATGGIVHWPNWWLSVNAFNDPANFAYWIEAESLVAGGGSNVASGNYSGGSARQDTISVASEYHYTLGAATVQDCAGYPFRVLMGFYGDPPTGYMQASIRDSSGTVTLQAGDRIAVTGSTTQRPVDLGVLRIPPAEFGPTYGALRLVITITPASAQTITMDWLTLFPAATTRFVKAMITGFASTEKLVIDESLERAYTADATNEFPSAIPMGAPLLLQPQVVNRIYLVASTSSGTVVTDHWTAKAWVKLRRWSL